MLALIDHGEPDPQGERLGESNHVEVEVDVAGGLADTGEDAGATRKRPLNSVAIRANPGP